VRLLEIQSSPRGESSDSITLTKSFIEACKSYNGSTYAHWRVTNATNEIHPFHIHQVHVFVYGRAGAPLRRPEWMDTVNLAPNESLDIIMDFTDPIIRGVSVFHCHLLKHEDKGMMAKILFE
jgi:suppressor of ftsI